MSTSETLNVFCVIAKDAIFPPFEKQDSKFSSLICIFDFHGYPQENKHTATIQF